MDIYIKDIDELRQFGIYLNDLSNNMREEFLRAQQHMYRINEGWADTDNDRFMAEFDKSVRLIDQVAEMMEQYSTFISRKCAILDEYHHTRLG